MERKRKKSKLSYKERQKMKFFNSLHKRGYNLDKMSEHQTNVKYTQAQKTISSYKKSENEFINKIVQDFEEAVKKIDSAHGQVVISKKIKTGNSPISQAKSTVITFANNTNSKQGSSMRLIDNMIQEPNSNKDSLSNTYRGGSIQTSTFSKLQPRKTTVTQETNFLLPIFKNQNKPKLSLRSVSKVNIGLQTGQDKKIEFQDQIRTESLEPRPLSQLDTLKPPQTAEAKASLPRSSSLFKNHQSLANLRKDSANNLLEPQHKKNISGSSWFKNTEHKRSFQSVNQLKKYPLLNKIVNQDEEQQQEYLIEGKPKVTFQNLNTVSNKTLQPINFDKDFISESVNDEPSKPYLAINLEQQNYITGLEKIKYNYMSTRNARNKQKALLQTIVAKDSKRENNDLLEVVKEVNYGNSDKKATNNATLNTEKKGNFLDKIYDSDFRKKSMRTNRLFL